MRTEEILHLASRHLYPTYARPEIVIERGEGCFVRDTDGNRYADLIGGIAVNALGHAHPRLVRALREQAGHLIHASNLFHNPYQAPLAARLAAISGLPRAFFCNSGTEAIEAAIKLSRARGKARGEPGRSGVVALEGSFHGRTFGALSATSEPSYRAPFEPLVPGFRFVVAGDEDALRRAITPETAALLIEPVQGEGGVRFLPASYLHAARERCDAAGALLVFDEVQCGLGRTGRWFAFQDSDVLPDLLCLAKPIAGGLPLGALLGREETAQYLTRGTHGSTFGGGPLACRVALEFLATVEEERLLDRVRGTGERFLGALRDLATRRPAITEIRGRGLMIGVDLDRPVAPVLEALRGRGWLAGSSRSHTLRLLPPYIIGTELLDRFVADLGAVLQGDPG